MSDDGALAGRASADRPVAASAALPCDDPVRALAERRLKQIADTLGLEAGHFERAYETARRALDGAGAQIMDDQVRRTVTALPEIDDPLVRRRAVDLMGALADGEDA